MIIALCLCMTMSVLGNVTSFAGTGREGYMDGTALVASFSTVRSIAVDEQDGSLYVSDDGNNLIRKISHDGMLFPMNPKLLKLSITY
jgi:hypothetical protein